MNANAKPNHIHTFLFHIHMLSANQRRVYYCCLTLVSLLRATEAFILLSPMPGTVLVSVLEISDFPLSSSTTVKVSMGKRECQTREREDISFPLISLRDNLIVRVEDAGGAEIAYAGIEARSIVERGTWDDFFSLGNIGTVHLKLQFVLSEEERSRIRLMREIAVKKKHGELLTNPLMKRQESNINGGNEISPSFSYNDVSESQRNHHQLEAEPVKDVDHPPSSCSSNDITDHVFAAPPDLKQNDADPYKKTSAGLPESEAIELLEPFDRRLNKIQNRSIPAEDVASPFESGGASSLLKSTEQNITTSSHLVSSNSNVKSSPSSVRQMIHAFETTQSQDLSSHVKQSSFNQQSTNPFATPSNLQDSKHDTGKEKLEYEPINIGVDKKSQFAQTSSRINWHWKGLNKTQSMKKNFFKTATESKHALKRKSKDFLETFAVKTTTSPEYKQSHIASHHSHPCKSVEDEKNSGGNSIVEDKTMIHSTSKDSQESCRSVRTPAETMTRLKDRYSSLENPGIWIFPDAVRSSCITTGGKRVMALAESCQSKMEDKNMTETEVTQSKELSIVKPSKSKASEDEIPDGPFQHAIKVAIIAGFGILVLLTRQRKSR